MTDASRVQKKPPLLLKESAIILIDVQNDFDSPGGKIYEPNSFYSEKAQSGIPRIRELLAFGRRAKMPIVYTVTQFHPRYIDTPRISISREIGALKRGSWGAAIIDDLAPSPDEDNVFIIECTRYNKFHATNLESILRALGVRTLIFVGGAANVCVESTIRGARERDFFPIMLSDCVWTFSEEMQKSALANVDSFFGSVSTSREVLGMLEAQL